MQSVFKNISKKNEIQKQNKKLTFTDMETLTTENEEHDPTSFIFKPKSIEFRNITGEEKVLMFLIMYDDQSIEAIREIFSDELLIKIFKSVIHKPFDLQKLRNMSGKDALNCLSMTDQEIEECELYLKSYKKKREFIKGFLTNKTKLKEIKRKFKNLSIHPDKDNHEILANVAIKQIMTKNSLSSGNNTLLSRFIKDQLSSLTISIPDTEDKLLEAVTSSSVRKITFSSLIGDDDTGCPIIVKIITSSTTMLSKISQSLPGNSHFYLVANGPINNSEFFDQEFINKALRMYKKNKHLLIPVMVEANEVYFTEFLKAFQEISKYFNEKSVRYIELMEPNSFSYCKVPQLAHKKNIEIIVLWAIVQKYLVDKFDNQSKRSTTLDNNDIAAIQGSLDHWVSNNNQQLVRNRGHVRTSFEKTIALQDFKIESLKEYHQIGKWKLTSLSYLVENKKMNRTISLRKMKEAEAN